MLVLVRAHLFTQAIRRTSQRVRSNKHKGSTSNTTDNHRWLEFGPSPFTKPQGDRPQTSPRILVIAQERLRLRWNHEVERPDCENIMVAD